MVIYNNEIETEGKKLTKAVKLKYNVHIKYT